MTNQIIHRIKLISIAFMLNISAPLSATFAAGAALVICSNTDSPFSIFFFASPIAYLCGINFMYKGNFKYWKFYCRFSVFSLFSEITIVTNLEPKFQIVSLLPIVILTITTVLENKEIIKEKFISTLKTLQFID